MKVGIDFFSSMKIIDGVAMYTGGTNYAKSILKSLKNCLRKDEFNIILFMPVDFQPMDEDKDLFIDKGCEIRYIHSLKECDCSDLKIVFFPQVNGTTLREIPRIKRSFPDIKVCATLHDRQHNFYKFDWYDRFYYKGFRRTGIICLMNYLLKKIAFTIEYARCIKYIDKMFTVSNYSMQNLMHRNIKNIKYFIQENIVDGYRPLNILGENYALFVGGGREEKNLMRTLEAFSFFKLKTGSQIRLKITGVTDETKKNLLKSKKISCDIVEKSAEFLPYVSYQQLAELYSGCRYVIFTSKGEGYGLPVREALGYGKTVLASRTTSVPEVAGAALLYVDPFDVESICNGFMALEDDRTLERLQGYILERNRIITEMACQDTKIMIDEILN